VLEDAVLCVDAGVVKHVGPAAEPWPEELLARTEHAEVVTLPMSIALPGMALAHHHAYSALARGMPLSTPMGNFEQVLERLWWPLDQSLSTEATEVSALVTAVDCLRCGVTSVADHHASPNALQKSLEVVGKSFQKMGLNALLCFEISDRYGQTGVIEALEENLDFFNAHQNDDNLRGMLGLHASFTLSDRTLKTLQEKSPASLPIHVHVAEDECDTRHARSLGHVGPLARLCSFGLLRPESLVVHGVHMVDDEIDLMEKHDAYLVHNPESNANNRVGYADIGRFPCHRILLGTDGMSSSLLGTLRAAFLAARASSQKPAEAMKRCFASALHHTPAYFERAFGRSCGKIRMGNAADFAIFDYASPTPVTCENLPSHLTFGLSVSPRARFVHAHGRLAIDDGRMTFADPEVLARESRRIAVCLWEAFAGQEI
jgi:cytosine/adenosine deaminase-related metal-dependent hydrolase